MLQTSLKRITFQVPISLKSPVHKNAKITLYEQFEFYNKINIFPVQTTVIIKFPL